MFKQENIKKGAFLGTGLILLFITGYFITNFPFGDSLYKLISGITLTSTALIVYFFLFKYIGAKKSVIAIVGLSLYGILIESVGVSTGFPYGGFQYTSEIGFKLFDLVPWNIFFVWAPLVIGSVVSSRYFFKKNYQVLLSSVFLLLLFDLIFDPVAVKLNFWVWDHLGTYYGIPISNFIGWIFSGTVSSLFLMYIINDRTFNKVESRNLTSGLFLSFLMWTSVSYWLNLWIPLVIGISIIAYLLKSLYWDLLVD